MLNVRQEILRDWKAIALRRRAELDNSTQHGRTMRKIYTQSIARYNESLAQECKG